LGRRQCTNDHVVETIAIDIARTAHRAAGIVGGRDAGKLEAVAADKR
jgi:hypothetical protein